MPEGQIIDLAGPDFARSASELRSNLAGAKIAELRIYPHSPVVDVNSLTAAVNQLKPLFALDAIVTLYELAGLMATGTAAMLQLRIGVRVGVAPPPSTPAAFGPFAPLALQASTDFLSVVQRLPGHTTATRTSALSRVLSSIQSLQRSLSIKGSAILGDGFIR